MACTLFRWVLVTEKLQGSHTASSKPGRRKAWGRRQAQGGRRRGRRGRRQAQGHPRGCNRSSAHRDHHMRRSTSAETVTGQGYLCKKFTLW